MDDQPDATYLHYENILEKRSRKIEADGESIYETGGQGLWELVGLRENVQNKMR